MNLKDVLKGPVITEKSSRKVASGRYVFKTDRKANKKEIARAVEDCFKVHVQGVQTALVKGKRKKVKQTRREIKLSDWKKAIVQVAEGEKIDIFETGE